MFANCVHATSASLLTFLNMKICLDQIVANLPQNATEVVKFLETFKMWVFFEKLDGVFGKNLNFVKIAKGGKFAVECVSNGIIS